MIYVISPQPWAGFHVSKHHYATELARLGHEVFFIDPPRQEGRRGEIVITPTELQTLHRVQYRPPFPYILKFKARWLFDLLMARQARHLREAIGRAPDLVWDFDNNFQFADLRVFGAERTIYHLVDDVPAGRGGAKHADLLLALVPLFATRFGARVGEAKLVDHAISQQHHDRASMLRSAAMRTPVPGERLRVGYVGNLDHGRIDWDAITTLVAAFPGCDFDFIGPWSAPVAARVQQLRERSNVRFLGYRSTQQIIELGMRMDAWLVLYRGEREHGGILNSHKILEYLATGAPVVSTRVTAYAGRDLLYMPVDHTHDGIVALFARMLSERDCSGEAERRQRRLDFALEQGYRHRVEQVDALLREVPVGQRETGAASEPNSLPCGSVAA